MQIIEPHIHMLSRTTDDYERMASAGIVAVVEPAFWLGCDRRYPESFLDYFNLLLNFEAGRAKKYGIDHFTCVGVNPKEANDLKLAHEVIDRMEEYLQNERAVAVGEIGFNEINDAEEEIFVRQLKLGDEKKLPVVIHTPHENKKAGTERILNIIKREGVDQKRILVDHNTEETIASTLQLDVWAGLTIYPVIKLSPQRAIDIIKEHGTDRMMINSSADWAYSDPLSVPTTAHRMKTQGFDKDEVKKVVFDNPKSFYGQSPHFCLC